jgi:anti-sigma B factor antagonist
MTFSVVRDGDRVVVSMPGQLVVSNRQELKQQVLDELGRGARTFVLDFRDTAYVDSAGLGTLVAMSKHIRQKVGELRLANLNVDLKHLLRLTRLDRLFRMEDDEGGSAGRPAALEPRPARSFRPIDIREE